MPLPSGGACSPTPSAARSGSRGRGCQGSRRSTTSSSGWTCQRLKPSCRRGRRRRWIRAASSWCWTARRCGASMGRSCPGFGWSRSMPPRPAWCWRKRGVRTKEEQAETAEEHEQAKQEAELSVAPRLLEQVRPHLRGRVVSGDALYCQKTLCRQLRAAGGDYLFAVKDNQPSLHADVALLFTDPPPGEVFLTAQSAGKHGGRLEQRHVRAPATLSCYVQGAGWARPGLWLDRHSCVRGPARS